jgi:hypothetical protein
MILFDFDTGEVITAAMNGLNNIKTGKLVCIVSGSGFGATGGTGTGGPAGTATASTGTVTGRMELGINQGQYLFQEISGTALFKVTKSTNVGTGTGTGGTTLTAITTTTKSYQYVVTGYQMSADPTAATTGGFDVSFGSATTTGGAGGTTGGAGGGIGGGIVGG